MSHVRSAPSTSEVERLCRLNANVLSASARVDGCSTACFSRYVRLSLTKASSWRSWSASKAIAVVGIYAGRFLLKTFEFP